MSDASVRSTAAATPTAAHTTSPRRLSRRSIKTLANIGAYTSMTIIAAFFLFPLVFLVVGAFTSNNVVLSEGGTWKAFIPLNPTLQNFGDASSRGSVGQLFLNSVIVTGTTVFCGLIVNSMFGYALARYRFRGRNLLVTIIIALVIIPLEAYAIPLLYLVAKLQWVDTYQVQILPFIANPFYIYLFYTFFLDIPKELEEAAQIDGANPFRVFLSIVVPLARPAYATVAILSFLASWGQLLWPVLVTRGPEVRPLPLGISEFLTLPPIQWGDILAFAAVMTVPLLIIFIIFQNAFVQGVARSGIKG